MSVSRLPPLNAVRAFEAAARLGSYVAAAKALHVTQPAIGRHIKLLEDHLQTQLFQRTPRGVVLTADGWRYFEQVSAGLTLIAEASYELTSRAQQRWLRLLVVPGFAARWLRHHLADFRAQYPDIRIALEPNASFQSVSRERADLGIAFGEGAEFAGVREALLQPPIFPVCSAEFLHQHGPVETLADLLKCPLLHEDDGYWWALWLQRQGMRTRLSCEMSYVSADQVIDLALAGAGIALTNVLLVTEELASGRLVRPLPHEVPLEGYWLLEPVEGLKPEARAFKAWLQARLSEW